MTHYAYGANEVACADCPVKAAGFDVDGVAASVATQYDTYVRMTLYEHERSDDDPTVDELIDTGPVNQVFGREGYGEGHVDEDTAREQFKRAAEAQNAMQVYDAVAEELGWE